MTDEETQGLRRENTYLKTRCAQLQGDVDDLTAQLQRMHEHARVGGATRRIPSSPLSGGS